MSTKRTLDHMDEIVVEARGNDKMFKKSNISLLTTSLTGSNKARRKDEAPAQTNVKDHPQEVIDLSKEVEFMSIGEAPLSPYILITPEKCDDGLNPDQYLKLIILANVGISPITKPALLMDFFPDPTPNQLASFTCNVMEKVRDNDVKALISMLETADDDFTLQCCNRFGESVIHTACRRGFTDMVKFLINDAKVSIRCRDDCGRTPFHDVFWNPQPQFEIVRTLLKQDPLLLFLTDKRGNTPFDYARRDHWDTWRRFLYENRSLINVDTANIKKYLL